MLSQPDTVITQLIELYSQCDSYVDRGEIRSGSDYYEFATYFARPNFLLQWKNKRNSRKAALLHIDGCSLCYFGQWEKVDDFGSAARMTAGSAMMATTFISSLLMPSRVSFDDSTNLTRTYFEK